LDINQIQNIGKLISHPIHVGKNGNHKNVDVQRFIFLSNDPWETLNEIKKSLKDIKDNWNELVLMKILYNCSVEFYNFDKTIYYEIEKDGYWDTKNIRYKLIWYYHI
jgi:hypothetical protein